MNADLAASQAVIRELRANGLTQRQIAQAVGRSERMVRFAGLSHGFPIVTGAAEAGDGTGAIHGRARPEVRSLGAVDRMAYAAGACGRRYAERLGH